MRSVSLCPTVPGEGDNTEFAWIFDSLKHENKVGNMSSPSNENIIPAIDSITCPYYVKGAEVFVD